MDIISRKYINEGFNSKAYIINDDYILLDGVNQNSYKNYQKYVNVINQISNVKSLEIPRIIELIEPCEEYPNGALIYKMIKGHTFRKEHIEIVNLDNIAKKLAEFMDELYEIRVDFDKDEYIKNELEITEQSVIELKEHLSNFMKTIEKAKELGFEVDEVSVDKTLLSAVPAVYVVISCAEATSNMSNLTGIIFGPRAEGKNWIEMVKNYRTQGFSPLIKRRFVIGSYVLQSQNQERYFRNAQRVRRLVVDEWKKLFKDYDAVILPVGSGPAKHLDGSKDILTKDTEILEEHLQIGNFGGFPSITIPNGFVSNMPVGVNITGNCYDDANVLNIAYALESAMPYKGQIAGGEKNE